MPTVKVRKMTDKELADQVAKQNGTREAKPKGSWNPFVTVAKSVKKALK